MKRTVIADDEFLYFINRLRANRIVISSSDKKETITSMLKLIEKFFKASPIEYKKLVEYN